MSRTEFKISETRKDNVTSATSTTYSSNIKFKNSPSRKEAETRVVYRDGRPEMENLIERHGNLETLIRSSACVPRLMGRRPLTSGIRDNFETTPRQLRDNLEVKLSSKIKKTQNTLASSKKGDREMKPYPRGSNILPLSKDLSIKMISEDFVKVPVEEVTSQRIGSGMTKMQSQ